MQESGFRDLFKGCMLIYGEWARKWKRIWTRLGTVTSLERFVSQLAAQWSMWSSSSGVRGVTERERERAR